MERESHTDLLREARIQLPLAVAHWNECADEQVRAFHVLHVLQLIQRIDQALGISMTPEEA